MGSSAADFRTQPQTPEALFSRAWEEGGRQPSLDAFLATGIADRAAVLVRLINVDLVNRRRIGQPARIEDYLSRYPELCDDAQALIDLVLHEHAARLADEPSLSAEEYIRRFPRLRDQIAARLLSGHSQLTAESIKTPTLPLAEQPAAPIDLSPPAATPQLHREVSREVSPTAAEGTSGGYTVLGELGRGGMGVVYKALDRRRNRVVALKRLPRLDPSLLARFKQEFRALADLAHPNLISLYELSSDGEAWFFTMELVEGVPFAKYVRGDPRLLVPAMSDDTARQQLGPSAEVVCRLRSALRQLAEGVSALHASGKLHRDLKPGNVLVTAAGRVVVLDFGLAAELDPEGRYLSTEPHIVGTVAYMAPEQAAAQAVTPASDWYSVGVMLFEALTGRLPFTGPALQVLRDRQEFEPAPPKEVMPGVPDDLNQLCVALLRTRPDDRPSGADVLRRLGREREAIPVPPKREVPLVGRRAHLAALADAFADVRAGRPRTMLIQGASGAGKSALVQWFLDDLCAQRAAVVMAGRCYERESVPYKAFDSLVDALVRFLRRLPGTEVEALLPRDVAALARVFPVLHSVEAVAAAPRWGTDIPDLQELRRRAFTALRELLARLGDRRPLVLFIDDLQWGDEDSAERLADLLSPPDPPILLLLAAYRGDEVCSSPCLQTALPILLKGTHNDVNELVVDPLTASDTHELAIRILGPSVVQTSVLAAAIARESGGNPFFVHELAGYLRSAHGSGHLTVQKVTLEDVIRSRVAALSTAARRLLEAVAVSGRPIEQAVAARAAQLGKEEEAAVGALRSGRLIRSLGPGESNLIETYHDRIRESVTAQLGVEQLRDCHRRLAESLEENRGCDPAVLANHLCFAGQTERAGELYEQAAYEAAAALAFERAARYYRCALDLKSITDAKSGVIRRNLADALANAGRKGQAADEYLKAAQVMEGASAFDCRLRAAQQATVAGNIATAIDLFRGLSTSMRVRYPSSRVQSIASVAWVRLKLSIRLRFRSRPCRSATQREQVLMTLFWSIGTSLGTVDPIRGSLFQARFMLMALKCGDRALVYKGLGLEAAYSAAAGRRGIGRMNDLISRMREWATDSAGPYARGFFALTQGTAAYLLGRWSEAEIHCRNADAVFREGCTGVSWETDIVRSFWSLSLHFQGRYRDLADLLPLIQQEARERGDTKASESLGGFIEPNLLIANDQPEAAALLTAKALDYWPKGQFFVQHFNILYIDMQIALYRGNPEGALSIYSAHKNALDRSMMLRVQLMRGILEDVFIRCLLASVVQSGGRADKVALTKKHIRKMRRERMPWTSGLTALFDASIAYTIGPSGRVCDLLRHAIRELDAVDMRVYAAAARRRLGHLLGGDEGQSLVGAAHDFMVGQGVKNPGNRSPTRQ